MRKKEVFNIVFSAIMISLSVVFDFISKTVPFFTLPNGGGVSLSMLPLAVIAVVCGFGYSLASGIIFGLINCFIIDGYAFHIVSFILDYIVAFAGVSVIGLFRKQILENKKRYFVLGFIIALLIRELASGFSGVINAGIWGYDAAFLEGVFGEGKGSVIWLYIFSFVVYNLPYIAISGALSIIIGLLIYNVLFLNENITKIESKKETED